MAAEQGSELRAHWDQRYRSGQTPWDTGITPPEVQGFWNEQALPFVGPFALDIGCGSGLNTLFLAKKGLRAIGFDLSGQALRLAHKRLLASGGGDFPQSGGATFVQADVSRLPVGNLGALYALDIGCLHSLSDARRPGYAEGVCRALRTGGHYHLYTFDRDPSDGPGARGMDEGEVATLFGGEMEIVAEELGVPTSHTSRRSRWYLLQKR